ncbi:MAG: DUF547 domain-containing protein [Bacteroidota bacterium]|nr:DUF547 domain-containing protein [Bacteroidota bacterium]
MFLKTVVLLITFLLISPYQKSIHDRWDIELKKYVSEEGVVNYKKWKHNKHSIESYIKALEEQPPKKYWSERQILSYWINAYNALTVLLILDNYPVESIKKIQNPWKKKVFFTNGISYSLGEIEHDILRKKSEPRIHFAINCASISCPKLSNNAYRSNLLESQLEASTRRFLNDESKNIFSQNQMKLSKIFLWYKKDFGSKKSLIKFLNLYVPRKISKKTRLAYLRYNWGLND